MGNAESTFGMDHRKLVAWQKSIKLVELVYRETAKLPHDELYGLKSQLKRSAVSIPANLAEGAGRNSTRELLQFVGVACGSRAELETHLEIAVRLGMIPRNSVLFQQLNRVAKLIIGLRTSIQARLSR